MLVERKIKSVYFGFSFFILFFIIDPHSLVCFGFAFKYENNNKNIIYSGYLLEFVGG